MQATVLTTLPAPRGPGGIDDHASTWLALLEVQAPDALHSEVEAWIAQRGRITLRIDGEMRQYVFRLDANELPAWDESPATSPHYKHASAGIKHMWFVPLAGEWPYGNLLDVPHNELAVLTAEACAQLIADLDALFQQHAPPPEPEPVRAIEPPKPLLVRGERPTWANQGLRKHLQERGWQLQPADKNGKPLSDGWRDYASNWHWSTAGDTGIGAWVACIEWLPTEREEVRAEVERLLALAGTPHLLATAKDGTQTLLYRSIEFPLETTYAYRRKDEEETRRMLHGVAAPRVDGQYTAGSAVSVSLVSKRFIVLKDAALLDVDRLALPDFDMNAANQLKWGLAKLADRVFSFTS